MIAAGQGFTSFFVSEMEMDPGASIPRHRHTIEEALIIIQGVLTLQIGMGAWVFRSGFGIGMATAVATEVEVPVTTEQWTSSRGMP
jgi:uncharacterized cupin superfamily protein